MSVFHKVESILDIKSVSFVNISRLEDLALNELISHFHTSSLSYDDKDEIIQNTLDNPSDIIFIGPFSTKYSDGKLMLCNNLRDAGYLGVIILLTQETSSLGGTSGITSKGFDHYLLDSHIEAHLEDSINWAILNRRRRNKYHIQFDNNPDAIFTVDSEGRVFDVNQYASEGTGLSPKKIVVGAINIAELGTLECFDELIKPLIIDTNAGKIFMHSFNQDERIFQIRTRIHNLSLMGLVATVVKTDITQTMSTRSMDILLHSVTLLSERDNYTAGHSSRVYRYCKLIVEALGLENDKRFIRDLYFASLLHDIGKIGVRDDILLKKGPLSESEFEILTTHPEKGYMVLKNYLFLDGTRLLVKAHHERHDGHGYPDKLSGKDIPFGASIIAVADGFDAMTSSRPYRTSLSYERAVAEIRDCAGTQYDKKVAQAFLSCITPEILAEVQELSQEPLWELSSELLESLF